MEEYKVGNIIKVKVMGFQPYGIFVETVSTNKYTGLIHISEISSDFVKDVSMVANLNDLIDVKILDIDETKKHLKVSIKATLPKERVKGKFRKRDKEEEIENFTSLDEKLDLWIEEQLDIIKKEGE